MQVSVQEKPQAGLWPNLVIAEDADIDLLNYISIRSSPMCVF